MGSSAESAEQRKLLKAKVFNRVLAKAIDAVIVGIFLEAVPRVGFFAGLIYLLISDGLFEGKSIGKRLINLRVVDLKSGKPCAFKGSIIRNSPFALGYILMSIPLVGFIFPLIIIIFEGLIMIGGEQGRRFGDELAGTQVLDSESEEQDIPEENVDDEKN